MTGPVIDLGELRQGPDLDTARLPRPPAARGRPLRGVLVLVLVLVGLAGSVPLTPREMVTLPAANNADAILFDDMIFLVEQLGATGQRTLTATRLPDGEQAWRTSLPVEGRYWGVARQGGTLLAVGYESGADHSGTITIALDPETGAYLWQQPGRPVALPDGGILLWSGEDEAAGALRAVDACCGTVRWQASVEAGADLTPRDGERWVDRLVLLRGNGQVEVRDTTTGTVLTRAHLPAPRGETPRVLHVVDDLLVTIDGSPSVISAYGLDHLDRRWQIPAVGETYVSACGVLLCLQSQSGGMRTIDAATGEPRWADDRWGWVWPYADRLLATAVSSAGPGFEDLVVLDPPTGRVLARLGRWEIVRYDVDKPLIGVRPHPDGGLVVAELDVRGGTVRVLDVLPDASGDCRAATGWLLCRRQDAAFGVWRLTR
ncbi:PQQ-binding-like beta-propeller repeat protein [Micromonospora sp. NPDC005172]|uniref:outer membrane protein assembly factor BamB family protein n=1 Tax=Micromonospora sp. NPDC005172 TaxID=3156867 RepID=UPI0033A8C700